MLVLLSIVAGFAIYDSTRMRIDRRESSLHGSTASVRSTGSAPTAARPAPTTGRPAPTAGRPAPTLTRTATGATAAPAARQEHSGDPVRTVLSIGLLIVGGITALTLGAIVVLIRFSRRRGSDPPLT